MVFIKELRQNEHPAARGRFAREVHAYETLQHPGLPRLIEHNANDWRDKRIALYLVLENVEGLSLADFIKQRGVATPDEALHFADRLSEIVEFCHNQEVVHRDLKPSNIQVRADNLADPVIVDFGLSFNSRDPDTSDLTRANEEVGNRFLRLPEHSTGGRSAISDVTHLVGLYFYVLTGLEPRVLVDAEGLKPHQRARAAESLSGAMKGQRLRRVQSLFDRGFDPLLDRRFQTSEEFRRALEYAHEEEISGESLSDMVERLKHVTSLPSHAVPAENAEVLQRFWHRAIAVGQDFASSHGLTLTQTGGPHDYAAERPFATVQLALTRPHETAKEFVRYEFRRLGPSDLVLVVGEEIGWRGSDELTEDFARCVVEPALSLFLAQSDA